MSQTPADTTTGQLTPPRFAHLHLHTEYSLLDGGNNINRLMDRVVELGMDSVAITDHGNVFGAVEFYAAARKRNIKPILGIEAYVAPGDRTNRTPGPGNKGGFHLVLLAENNTGWSNLLKLTSDSFINGFYYKPRMDRSTLEKWGDGIIAINGHLGSSIAYHLVQFVQSGQQASWDAAVAEAKWHAKAFGTNENGDPRFYIELQEHDVLDQQRINPHLIKLARELNLPLVGDNDVHYLGLEDYDDHDSLCCISMAKTKDDPSRMHYSRDLYLKSPQQMAEAFAGCPEAVENTVRIAERCNVELEMTANHAPVVKIVHPGEPPRYESGDPTEWFNAYCARFELIPYDHEKDADLSRDTVRLDCDKALRDLCEAGLIWRYGVDGITDTIRARLDRELKILADKLISAYFLIVWDFVNWARQRGIPASARGSGVGTMVGYVLGLSNACPERFGLLFERFTDPDRSEYPDIDIDICQHGRADVINYVREKYGHVAQIITFGRLKARAAIKDVSRIRGLAPAEGQRLANLVSNELNITIDQALEKEEDFRKEYENDPIVRQVIDTARALEGHARHSGVHAAGVVIATEPLDNIVPLCRASGNEDVVTQWDGPTCEEVGLLKMDFLGLRTLSTIERCCNLVRETVPEDAIWAATGQTPGDGVHPLDLDRLHYEDSRVLDLFRRGDTAGIFQFESGGMRKLLTQMQPDRLEDLIAANALFRPGPMELIPDYCDRKHGKQAVPKAHEIVQKYTEETYGIMVYQEQVMQIVHGLGDIPLRDAYTLIKAISKKKVSVIDSVRPKFIEGAGEKGVTADQANELFDLILKFAGYGFNKSHSSGYAIIAYQTAYLRTYFPNQYMAALLTFEAAARKVEDWVPYLQTCKQTFYADSTDEQPHQGVRVEPPDVNYSGSTFTVNYDEDELHDAMHGHIRFGMSAIKGAARSMIESIVAEREENGRYESLFNFCERIGSGQVNKATIESLIRCGAFDSMHSRDQRASMLTALDDAMAAGNAAAEDRRRGQMSIFGGGGDDDADAPEMADPPLPSIPPWDRLTMLENEKDVLGFHLSGHPLDEYKKTIQAFSTVNTTTIARAGTQPLIFGGMITRVRLTVTKKGRSAGQRMAMLTITDRDGAVDGVVFSNVFARCAQHLQENAMVMLIGTLDQRGGEPSIIVDQVIPMHDAARHLAGRIELNFTNESGEALLQHLQMLAGILERAAASRTVDDGTPADVYLRLIEDNKLITLRCNRARAIADRHLLDQFEHLIGADNIKIVSGGIPQSMREKPKRWERKPAGGSTNGASNGADESKKCASLNRY